MSEKYNYTLNSSFRDAYHDCKLVADSIHDAESFQKADAGLVIGYMDRIIEALEKQIPKRVIRKLGGTENCPCCDFDNSSFGYGVCIDCGQALDWSE